MKLRLQPLPQPPRSFQPLIQNSTPGTSDINSSSERSSLASIRLLTSIDVKKRSNRAGKSSILTSNPKILKIQEKADRKANIAARKRIDYSEGNPKNTRKTYHFSFSNFYYTYYQMFISGSQVTGPPIKKAKRNKKIEDELISWRRFDLKKSDRIIYFSF